MEDRSAVAARTPAGATRATIPDETGEVYAARAKAHGPADSEPSEKLVVRWVAFDEAPAMTADGRITDALTVMGVQQLALEPATRGPAGQ